PGARPSPAASGRRPASFCSAHPGLVVRVEHPGGRVCSLFFTLARLSSILFAAGQQTPVAAYRGAPRHVGKDGRHEWRATRCQTPSPYIRETNETLVRN